MTLQLHVQHDDNGYFVADQDGFGVDDVTFPNRHAAAVVIRAWQADIDQAEYEADRIDGLYLDDLGK